MNSYAELTRYQVPCNRDAEEHRAMLAKLDRTPPRYYVRSWARLFTDEQILEIRQRYAAGTVSQARIADEYGVTYKTIGRIVRGDTYANVDGDS